MQDIEAALGCIYDWNILYVAHQLNYFKHVNMQNAHHNKFQKNLHTLEDGANSMQVNILNM